jgi:hypothetical protein
MHAGYLLPIVAVLVVIVLPLAIGIATTRRRRVAGAGTTRPLRVTVAGPAEVLDGSREALSETIRAGLTEALGGPVDEREEVFQASSGRAGTGPRLTVQIHLPVPRTDEDCRGLAHAIRGRLAERLRLAPDDIEVTALAPPVTH